MKIAILSDIHANLPALEAVLSEVEKENCERIYHVGDLVAIGSFPAECVELAQKAGIINIMGNHDALVANGMPSEAPTWMSGDEYMHQHWTHSRINRPNRDYIRTFPYKIEEKFGNIRVQFLHFALNESGDDFLDMGLAKSDEGLCSMFNKSNADVIFFGHTHRSLDLVHDGVHFHNPASLGCTATTTAAYSIMETDGETHTIRRKSVAYRDDKFLERYVTLEIPASDEIDRYFFKGRIERWKTTAKP